MAHAYDSWESYFYPETFDPLTNQGTLRNRFNVRDRDVLSRLEYRAAADAERALRVGEVSVPQTFDAAHVKAIHRQLLGDVYDWAGEYRTVNLLKGKGGFAHVERGHIDAHLELAAGIIAGTDWPALERGEFTQRTAEVFAHVNQAHPFREGNGRATKLFLHDVAERSPFRLDFDRVDPDTWNMQSDASRPRDALTGVTYPAAMVPVFDAITTRRPTAIDEGAHQALQATMVRIRQAYPQAPTPGQTEGRADDGHSGPLRPLGYGDDHSRGRGR